MVTKKREDGLAEKTRPPWKTLLVFGFRSQKRFEDNQSMVLSSGGL